MPEWFQMAGNTVTQNWLTFCILTSVPFFLVGTVAGVVSLAFGQRRNKRKKS